MDVCILLISAGFSTIILPVDGIRESQVLLSKLIIDTFFPCRTIDFELSTDTTFSRDLLLIRHLDQRKIEGILSNIQKVNSGHFIYAFRNVAKV